MTSHSSRSEQPVRRHDLIYVRSATWRSLLEERGDLAQRALVARWVDRGWPLVRRRPMPGEEHGVAVGLPLPPCAGKQRLAFQVLPEAIVATALPPDLITASRAAPRDWRPALDALAALSSRYGLDARVFGGLAWQALTGLGYLTDQSDLDLLLHVYRDTDPFRLVADLAAIEAVAPMRLDGELIRHDGAAVSWRELRAGRRELLVKTMRGVALVDTHLFLLGRLPT